MSRNDPRHGIWILPILIAAIIGSTVVFVGRLPEAVISVPETSATSTTLADTASTTTSTTVDPATAELVASTTAFQVEAAALAEEAVTLNQQWDDREFDFGSAKTRFDEYRDKVDDFKNRVLSTTVPTDLQDLWQAVADATQGLDDASAQMLNGLLDPKSATGRRDGLASIGTSQESLNTAFDDLLAQINGSSS
ncbi:MAG: hypothetical protein GXP36_13025 [Actinobacteria bacterium]|nr:hypothetical protein [Actinomycetota bacterium]